MTGLKQGMSNKIKTRKMRNRYISIVVWEDINSMKTTSEVTKETRGGGDVDSMKRTSGLIKD